MRTPSRTPEGLPSRCPLCGAVIRLEFSEMGADAPCPKCGHLLWRSSELLGAVREFLAGQLGVRAELITADTRLDDLGLDSLGVVEFIMAFEEEFPAMNPKDSLVCLPREITTVGHLIRFVEQRGPGEAGGGRGR
ncbi:MAG: acyl carrier protein [Planctomycetales bacterium]|nr:acyl carrier protein [Planctomycetales bacterium]